MSDVGCCRSRKLALSLTSLREVGVYSPARKSADTFATSGCFLRGHDARVSMLLQANGSIWRDNASWFLLASLPPRGERLSEARGKSLRLCARMRLVRAR
jgi:hypothetical protein